WRFESVIIVKEQRDAVRMLETFLRSGSHGLILKRRCKRDFAKQFGERPKRTLLDIHFQNLVRKFAQVEIANEGLRRKADCHRIGKCRVSRSRDYRQVLRDSEICLGVLDRLERSRPDRNIARPRAQPVPVTIFAFRIALWNDVTGMTKHSEALLRF